MTAKLLHDIVGARHLGGQRLWLRFEDGVEGEVDLGEVITDLRGVLASFRDPAYVAQVRVDPELGTVVWPGSVDLDPVVLYCATKGIPVPSFGGGASAPRRSARKSGRTKGGARAAGGSGRGGRGGGTKRRATRR